MTARRAHILTQYGQLLGRLNKALLEARGLDPEEAPPISEFVYARRCARKAPAHALVGRIRCTLKIHKPPGRVELRLIHSAADHHFRSRSKIISVTIDRLLATLHHLAISPNGLIKKLEAQDSVL